MFSGPPPHARQSRRTSESLFGECAAAEHRSAQTARKSKEDFIVRIILHRRNLGLPQGEGWTCRRTHPVWSSIACRLSRAQQHRNTAGGKSSHPMANRATIFTGAFSEGSMEEQLSLEFLRVVENGAIAAARTMGFGGRQKAEGRAGEHSGK